ncbi:unnamed protein product, partial [Bubo scandiacus]
TQKIGWSTTLRQFLEGAGRPSLVAPSAGLGGRKMGVSLWEHYGGAVPTSWGAPACCGWVQAG